MFPKTARPRPGLPGDKLSHQDQAPRRSMQAAAGVVLRIRAQRSEGAADVSDAGQGLGQGGLGAAGHVDKRNNSVAQSRQCRQSLVQNIGEILSPMRLGPGVGVARASAVSLPAPPHALLSQFRSPFNEKFAASSPCRARQGLCPRAPRRAPP